MRENIQEVAQHTRDFAQSYMLGWQGVTCYKRATFNIVSIQFILILLILTLVACSNSLQYVKDSSDFSSFELDYHDIESVVDENAKAFAKSNVMKKHDTNKKAVIAISNIENRSDEKIDTEFMSRKLIRRLSEYEQIVLTNAVAGSGATTDKMIEDSRNLTENNNFNQYTTKEKGTILAPEYSLSGKIIKSIKNIGKKQRVDYQFLFIVSDLDSGREVWSHDTFISKAIKKEEIHEYSTAQTHNVEANKYNEIDWNNYHNTDSIFGGIVAADIGFLSFSHTNMPRTPYTYKDTSYPNNGKDATMDIYLDESNLNFPATLRIGGFYKKDKGLYVEADFLYRIFKTTFNAVYLDCSKESGGYCSVSNADISDAIFQHSQIGGNLRIGYGATWDTISLIGYVGGGAFIDVDSSMTIRGPYNLIKNINNIYPFWEIGGYLTYKDKFFAEVSFRYDFNGDIDKYWTSNTSLNIGIGVFLSRRLFR